MRPIDADSLLKGIEELRQSPWFKRGKLEETDTYVDYNRSLSHIGYLERKEAIEIIIDLCIKKEPTVEVEPVKHGQWKRIESNGNQRYQCSKCNGVVNYTSKFCPHCGARMDGDSE